MKVMSTMHPVILSASRATDIPAFYGKWFLNRWQEGYCVWINPFNRVPVRVSFDKVRAVVFWTKDPAPFEPYLNQFERYCQQYYFHFTVNDYENESLEPGIPPLDERIKTFCKLSQNLGAARVIWRFDPILLGSRLTLEMLVDRFKSIGRRLTGYTEKAVISFADISAYRKVKNNLGKCSEEYREPDQNEKNRALEEISIIAKGFGMCLATCAETDAEWPGVEQNRCIDDRLLHRLYSHDQELMNFLGYTSPIQTLLFTSSEKDKQVAYRKDRGQRAACGCVASKDIGQYDTCAHRCVYCYANSTPDLAAKNYKNHDAASESIL